MERWQREEALMAFLLLLLGVMLYVGWWFVLSFHSPVVADPATGHTVHLSLSRAAGPGFYVRRFEALIALSLGMSSFIMPGVYVAWRSFRRHRPK
jgi:uncharacterized membrane protein (DUF485 family)